MPGTCGGNCCAQLLYGGSGYSGSLSDVWVFNPGQGAWTQPHVGGEAPEAREMHGAGMITGTRMLVYGGRGASGRCVREGSGVGHSAAL